MCELGRVVVGDRGARGGGGVMGEAGAVGRGRAGREQRWEAGVSWGNGVQRRL